MEVDFDNDELSKSLGPTKGVELRGISSNKSKKQLQRTGIAKALLQQANSSSNSELKGEMNEMKSSLVNVMGVLKGHANRIYDAYAGNAFGRAGDDKGGVAGMKEYAAMISPMWLVFRLLFLVVMSFVLDVNKQHQNFLCLFELDVPSENFGFRGEAISSLSDISLLEVTTKARGRPNGYRKIIKACILLLCRVDL
ncbi:hypothetical protein IFM89_025874 [Coptis chinensis]|uniref:Uncharacterized protein n=1 Tax=Coptis chinensis TaxID=261450 RepID=A0A835GXX4_9MAGN|nr:hypothetical protein IFM89_025874 [Coptis chinensis]